VSVAGLGVPAALGATLLAGLLVGALGRVLAAAPTEPGRRWAVVALAAVAVLVGGVLGELAATAVFTGPSTRALDEQAARAGAAVTTGERGSELTRLRTERAVLDERVAQAVARRDEALLVARCEYRPTPGCPPLITGDPGRGPETEQARTALAGADADVAAARADRDRQAPDLDRAIAGTAEQVDHERAAAEALARADTGLIAKWQAMNDYTLARPSALIPRLGATLTLVLVTLLPLLLRLLRGPSEQDRLTRSRRLRRAAEQDADTAIAVRRAEVRAARELRRQDELLALPGPTGSPGSSEYAEAGYPGSLGYAESDYAGSPGHAEAGYAGSPGYAEADYAEVEPIDVTVEEEPALTAGDRPVRPTGTVDRPARSAELERPARPAELATRGRTMQERGAELLPARANALLDKLPGPLPFLGRTVTGMARPFVPGPMARLVSDPTAPMRRARTILEEVEEFQLSILHRRRVTVTDTEEHQEAPATSAPSGPPAVPEGEPDRLDDPRRSVSVTQVHRESHAPGGRLTTGSGAAEDETTRAELEQGRRELEQGRRELPRG
jgi:hypothetical protein